MGGWLSPKDRVRSLKIWKDLEIELLFLHVASLSLLLLLPHLLNIYGNIYLKISESRGINQLYLRCVFVSAAAVHARLCGSLPSGGSDLSLPSAGPGDSIHLLPARLHHPPLPEPHDLWFS